MKNKEVKTSLILSSIFMIITLTAFLTFMICDLFNVDILIQLKWIIIAFISLLIIGVIVFMIFVIIKKDKEVKKDLDSSYVDLKFLIKAICEEFRTSNCPCCKTKNNNTEGDTPNE